MLPFMVGRWVATVNVAVTAESAELGDVTRGLHVVRPDRVWDFWHRAVSEGLPICQTIDLECRLYRCQTAIPTIANIRNVRVVME